MRILTLIGLGMLALLALAVSSLTEEPPRPIMPEDGSHTADWLPEMRWDGGGLTIYLDETPDFTSPLIMKTQDRIFIPPEPLKLTTYYWKAPPSPIWTFTVDSHVAVEFSKEDDRHILRNVGNTALALTRKLRSSITGAVIAVDAEARFEADEESSYEVRQHE
ncbi:MAG: hypothetical protein ABIH34_07785 [Nanoarchaeota archaeon]